jgi:hypothetical protein
MVRAYVGSACQNADHAFSKAVSSRLYRTALEHPTHLSRFDASLPLCPQWLLLASPLASPAIAQTGKALTLTITAYIV